MDGPGDEAGATPSGDDGASGDLTGFGGGLAAKEALLRLEMENSDFSLDA